MAIEIVDYSERSIAVFGDTQNIKEDLKLIGGRFNPRLTHNGVRTAGWIFPKTMRDVVENLCESEDEINILDTKKNVPAKHDLSTDDSAKSFHRTLKALISMEGNDYLIMPGLVNALSDFNAYEQFPALKGILKIIIQDGFANKLLQCPSWDMSAKKVVMDLIQSYAFDISLATYAMQSIAYASDILTESSVILPNSISQNHQTPIPSAPQNTAKPSSTKKWRQMSNDEKEDHLNSLVEIQQSNYGVQIDSIYVPYESSDSDCCYVNYQLSITSKLPDRGVHFCGDIFDIYGRQRSHQSIVFLYPDNCKKGSKKRGSINYWKFRVKKDDISRIVFYIQES